jgi:hypothetical protein
MRLRLQPLALFVPLLLLSACGSGESTKPETATISASADRSPTELALAIVHASETSARSTSTLAEAGPEGGGPTTVTVLQEGIPDDSVEAVRHVLRFEPDGDAWKLVSNLRTQRCRDGRGHQDFAAGDCV